MAAPSSFSRRALCVLGAASLFACERAVTVTIEREEIQQRVATRFPVQQPVLLGTLTFENPRVLLREGSDRLGVELDVKLQLPLMPLYTGVVAVSGKPVYRPAEKAFYLQDATIERLEVSGLPAGQAASVRAPAEVVARGVLDRSPVYVLQQRNWKEVTAEHTLRSIEVKDGKLRATLAP